MEFPNIRLEKRCTLNHIVQVAVQVDAENIQAVGVVLLVVQTVVLVVNQQLMYRMERFLVVLAVTTVVAQVAVQRMRIQWHIQITVNLQRSMVLAAAAAVVLEQVAVTKEKVLVQDTKALFISESLLPKRKEYIL